MNSHPAVAGSFRDVMFDAVSHYREPADALWRYLDRKVAASLRDRHGLDTTNAPVSDGAPRFLDFGGDGDSVTQGWPISRDGAMARDLKAPLVPPSHWDRDARMDVMDTQGVERAWLFPMLATTWEDRLRSDPDGAAQVFIAFNRWLENAWGFAFRDRLFAAPHLSLVDPDRATAELQWCLDRDARVVMIRPAPAFTRDGLLSPTSRAYDGFWALAQEAGITVAVHAGETGYMRHGYATARLPHGSPSPEQLIWSYLHEERPILDFLAAVLVDRLLERFPGLRLASVENGARFLPELIHKIATIRDNHPARFRQDPVELLRRHVWVVPHWQDDVDTVIENLGAGQVLFGSGWPLPGGPQAPSDYMGDLAHLPSVEQTAILHGNADFLTQRVPGWSNLSYNPVASG